MARFPDIGVQLEATGAEITTSYFEGSPLASGRFDLRAQADLTAVAGSAMGPVVVKLQSSRDGQRWCDVATTRDDSVAVEVEHTFVVVAGQTVSYSLSARTRGFVQIRWLVRIANGSAQDSDQIMISGVAV